MSQKIEIPKHTLVKFYLKKKLSTHKIAGKFNCDPGVIQRRLREYKLKLRKPTEKINISKRRLHNLYAIRCLSTQKISELLGVSSCWVYYKLKELNINPRAKKKIHLSKKELCDLYYNKFLPLSQIAKKYNCATTTIFDRMKKYGLTRRDKYQSNIIHRKKRFTGKKISKSYMIGFRLGDLNVKSKSSCATVFLKSNTTKEDQFNLIKNVYGIYGHFRYKICNQTYYIWCNLDKSFNFLVPKQDNIEEWILNDEKFFLAFLAGYIDAEGNISVRRDVRLRIRTYDKNLLFQIYKKLNSMGINTKFNLVRKKGIYNGRKHNGDCWGVFVYSKDSLFKLFKLLKPFMKHKKRYNDLLLGEKNLLERIKKV